jgi:hypothetical protein
MPVLVIFGRSSKDASRSLSSGAHSRDPLARNDVERKAQGSPRHCETLLRRSNPVTREGGMAEAPLCLYVVSTEVNGLGTKVFSSEETSRRSTFGPFEFAWKSHDQGVIL